MTDVNGRKKAQKAQNRLNDEDRKDHEGKSVFFATECVAQSRNPNI